MPLPPPPPFALPPPRFVAAPIVVRDRIVAGRRAHPWSGPANPPRAAENASVAAVTRCDAPIDAGICGEARVSDDATGPGAVPTRAGARSRRDVVSMVAPLLSQLMHVRGRASSNAECRRPRLSRCAFFLDPIDRFFESNAPSSIAHPNAPGGVERRSSAGSAGHVCARSYPSRGSEDSGVLPHSCVPEAPRAMPPKKGSGSSKDKESDAIAVEEQRQAKRSREIFDTAVDGRQLSRVRPSSLRELVPSKLLRRSDCKDVHKRSSVKKSRYMTIFPGQLAHLKEGKIGSLAKLDTQNPVLYIEYGALGRLKLEGTIVRSKTTRYFTLNVKSRDRLNLEDWFDSCVVFGRYAWVGTVDENPGEAPLPFPDALKHVAAAAAADKNVDGNDKNDESAKKEEDEEEPMDPAVAACVAAAKAAYKPPTEADLWTQSVAAEEGAKPIVSRNIADDDDDDDDGRASR